MAGQTKTVSGNTTTYVITDTEGDTVTGGLYQQLRRWIYNYLHELRRASRRWNADASDVDATAEYGIDAVIRGNVYDPG